MAHYATVITILETKIKQVIWNGFFSFPGAQLKQRSLDPDRRRQSLGAIIPTNIHRASDAFVDPHHAAILFRDSRGVSESLFCFIRPFMLCSKSRRLCQN